MEVISLEVKETFWEVKMNQARGDGKGESAYSEMDMM